MSNVTTGIFLVLCGLFAIIGTTMNWRFVTHPGKLFNRLFGDTIARIIYILVGALIFVLGIGQIFGVDWLKL